MLRFFMKFLFLFLFTFTAFSMGSKKPPAATPVIAKPLLASAIENEIEKEFKTILFNFENLKKFNPDVNYWLDVVKAVAYAESGFKPNTRYVEPPSLGIDVVTKRQNTSEGLLQMSYQDAKYHGCKFDWLVDKSKKDTDPTKTIFNIRNNIECGLIVMNKLVGKNKNYIFNTSNYWAVLKPNNKRHYVFLTKFKAYRKARGL